MISEIVRFMEIIDDDFKSLGIKPKEGIHILIKLKEQNNEYVLSQENIQYEIYSKKVPDVSDFLKKCMILCQNAWMIETNKCFDLPAKSIHSCSPYCVGFKKEHIEGGTKYQQRMQEKKEVIFDRFDNYFKKSFALFDKKEKAIKYKCISDFFILGGQTYNFLNLIKQINFINENKRNEIESKIRALDEEKKNTSKNNFSELNNHLTELKSELELFRELSDSDYIIFYFDVPLSEFIKVHQKYLADTLFNKADYNTLENQEGEILGVSGFFNSIDSGGNKPFNLHQTAPFNITSRISNVEAKHLFDFEDMLKRGILPNPLPIFIFKEELQKDVVGIFKEYNFKLSYREIIEKLWNKYQNEFGNYYLIFYQNTKDGLKIKDFDFVSNFDYELRDSKKDFWKIHDLFNINFSLSLDNVFEFQAKVLQCIFNNNLIVEKKDGTWLYKYFDDIESKFFKSDTNYLLALKYRYTFYNFVYKSKRSSVSKSIFDEIMLTTILEDIRLDNIKNGNHSEYFNIRRKLNIWFSLYENFSFNNNNGEPDMASRLIEYQKFVDSLCNGDNDFQGVKEQHFAFAAGQIIDYIRNKSKSADKSYLLLEPYLQQSECAGLKRAISNDFSRYKHENFSRRFERVASFVLSYETSVNMKKLLPELLAGIFSKNQLYSNTEYSNQTINLQEIQEDE